MPTVPYIMTLCHMSLPHPEEVGRHCCDSPFTRKEIESSRVTHLVVWLKPQNDSRAHSLELRPGLKPTATIYWLSDFGKGLRLSWLSILLTCEVGTDKADLTALLWPGGLMATAQHSTWPNRYLMSDILPLSSLHPFFPNLLDQKNYLTYLIKTQILETCARPTDSESWGKFPRNLYLKTK